MIGYYYKSESDVVFRRHSLEYEKKNKNSSRNSNTCVSNDLNNVITMCNLNDPFQKATTCTNIVMNSSCSSDHTV